MDLKALEARRAELVEQREIRSTKAKLQLGAVNDQLAGLRQQTALVEQHGANLAHAAELDDFGYEQLIAEVDRWIEQLGEKPPKAPRAPRTPRGRQKAGEQ